MVILLCLRCLISFMIISPQTAKVFAKLQMRRSEKCVKDNENVKSNGTTDHLARNELKHENESCGGLQALSSHHVANRGDIVENLNKSNSSFAMEIAHSKTLGHTIFIFSKNSSVVASSGECHECVGSTVPEDPILRLGSHCNTNNVEPEAKKLVMEDDVQKQQEIVQFFRESTRSHGSLSSKGDNDSNVAVECEIQWEDLQLGEEIGQGNQF